MTNIKDRPDEIEGRLVPGHWEGDLILGAGGSSAIGTLVERSSRFVVLVKMPTRKADVAACAFAGALNAIPAPLRKTLTYDQGKEMANHQSLAADTGMRIFFADPHSPWQRGSNENTNGLLRQYFPKGTSLSGFDQDDLDTVAASLNDRPPKKHSTSKHQKSTSHTYWPLWPANRRVCLWVFAPKLESAVPFPRSGTPVCNQPCHCCQEPGNGSQRTRAQNGLPGGVHAFFCHRLRPQNAASSVE